MTAAARCPLLLSLCRPTEFIAAIRSSRIKLDFNQCPVFKSSKKLSKFLKKQWTAFQLGKQLFVYRNARDGFIAKSKSKTHFDVWDRVGNAFDFWQFNIIHKTLHNYAMQYGPGLVKFWIGTQPWVLVADAKLMHEVVTTKSQSYPHRPSMDALNFVYNAFFDVPATEAGVFFANGEAWKRNRHTVMMILHKQSFRAKSVDVFNRKADNLVKQWLSREGNDTQLELLDEMIKFSTDAIGELCYSIDFGSIEGKYFEFVEHVRFLLGFVNRYLYAPAKVLAAMKYLAPIIPEQRQFNKSVEYLRAKGQVLLQDRLSDTSGVKKDDILALLLDAQPKGLTTIDVNSILFDLMGAGHDSVSNLFASCLALLSAHPESQQRLYEEIEQHMGDRDYLFEDDLRAMPYLTAVVKESLRLFPSGALTTRMSSEDTQLGGHQIPAGTPLLLLYYTFLRHPKFWTEPEAFKPERWLVEKNCPRFNNVANIPFGAGARGCIGGRFASTEAKVIVAKVIRRFRLEPLFNCKTDLDSQVQFTLRPAKPLRVKLCPRM